jgi:hypothetical protein
LAVERSLCGVYTGLSRSADEIYTLSIAEALFHYVKRCVLVLIVSMSLGSMASLLLLGTSLSIRTFCMVRIDRAVITPDGLFIDGNLAVGGGPEPLARLMAIAVREYFSYHPPEPTINRELF